MFVGYSFRSTVISKLLSSGYFVDLGISILREMREVRKVSKNECFLTLMIKFNKSSHRQVVD